MPKKPENSDVYHAKGPNGVLVECFVFFSSATKRNSDDDWAVRVHDFSVKQRVLVSGEIRVNKISKRVCVGVCQRPLGASGA